jgi:hypothetical protein
MKNSWQLMINLCCTTQWILQLAAILAIRRTHVIYEFVFGHSLHKEWKLGRAQHSQYDGTPYSA